MSLMSYSDAIALPHGDPHGHGDGWDCATKDVQHGETKRLTVVSGSDTGKAGTAPEGKTAFSKNK